MESTILLNRTVLNLEDPIRSMIIQVKTNLEMKIRGMIRNSSWKITKVDPKWEKRDKIIYFFFALENNEKVIYSQIKWDIESHEYTLAIKFKVYTFKKTITDNLPSNFEISMMLFTEFKNLYSNILEKMI